MKLIGTEEFALTGVRMYEKPGRPPKPQGNGQPMKRPAKKDGKQ